MKHLERVLGITLAAVVLTGCGARENQGTEIRLNPDKPVSLTIWHYYNGAQQATFNALVEEFNATVGKERGIYVEGYSQGSVSDLEKAVTSAMKGEIGAGSLPDIFPLTRIRHILYSRAGRLQIYLFIFLRKNCRNMWIPIFRRAILMRMTPCI